MRPLSQAGIPAALGALILGVAAGSALPGRASAQPAPSIKVLIAILPLRVHSETRAPGLAREVAVQLAEHLQAGGRVEVVDPANVAERVGEEGPQSLADSDLRVVARQIGANYVVAGSLTELAGSYSLDLRLSPAELTESRLKRA